MKPESTIPNVIPMIHYLWYQEYPVYMVFELPQRNLFQQKKFSENMVSREIIFEIRIINHFAMNKFP